MMRSMFSAVTGLRTHQTRMDVIAHNIANVNTHGYKGSRATFQDLFNQTISGATRPNPVANRGGRNPMQVGLGVNMGSIDRLMTTGAAQRTDWAFDLMIEGEGFFVLQDTDGSNFFTRAGAFRVDEAGQLVNPNGLQVTGWHREWNDDRVDSAGRPSPGWSIVRGPVQPIRITPEMEFSMPRPTSIVEWGGNLNQHLADAGVQPSTMHFYDSLGSRWVVDVEFRHMPGAGTDGMAIWEKHVRRNDDGYIMARLATNSEITHAIELHDLPAQSDEPGGGDDTRIGELAFNAFGTLAWVTPNQNTDPLPGGVAAPDQPPYTQMLNLEARWVAAPTVGGVPPNSIFGRVEPNWIDNPDPPPPDIIDQANPLTTNHHITLDFRSMRAVTGDRPNANSTPLDGSAPGHLIGFSVGGDGVIMGVYSNGDQEPLAQVVMWQFRNPAGLESVGGNLFQHTANSGHFDGIGMEPGTGGSRLLSGVLEMSNVDLSQEFSEMITTQRGFQSNARVITVSDEMLQELANLRR